MKFFGLLATLIAFFVTALVLSPHDRNSVNAKLVIADHISPNPGRNKACLSSSRQRSLTRCKRFSTCQCPVANSRKRFARTAEASRELIKYRTSLDCRCLPCQTSRSGQINVRQFGTFHALATNTASAVLIQMRRIITQPFFSLPFESRNYPALS